MSDFSYKTLETIEKTELIKVFNQSFAEYFVKIELNEQIFSDKILAENIDLSKSVGAFLDKKLVGFILVGIESENSYNGGTGVLPNARGQKLTEKMYQFLLPKLKSDGIVLQHLEVINENFPAIKSYEKIGFQKVRTLACFKGKIKVSETNKNVEIKEISEIDEPMFKAFWNSQPSWQNSLSAIKQTRSLHKIIGAFIDEKLIGYIIFTASGRIKQVAVNKNFRNQKIGQTLFSQVNNQEIIVTNIDENDRETISFLQKLGLKMFIKQFEMTLEI